MTGLLVNVAGLAVLAVAGAFGSAVAKVAGALSHHPSRHPFPYLLLHPCPELSVARILRLPVVPAVVASSIECHLFGLLY